MNSLTGMQVRDIKIGMKQNVERESKKRVDKETVVLSMLCLCTFLHTYIHTYILISFL